MANFIIRTPVPNFDGDVGSIHFKDGVAVVPDDAQEITYLRSAGYIFEDLEAAAVEEPETPIVEDVDGDGIDEELPKKAAPVAEWRAFAVAHGIPEVDADAMSKDALIAHYNTPKEG